MNTKRAFLSYRRNPDGATAGRIGDRIVTTFGEDALFIDVDGIEPGTDFRRRIEDAIDQCDVLLVLIGKSWLDATDDSGNRRLDNPQDFVRIEIERAFAKGIRVVPLLLDGATMPAAEKLPDSIRQLAFQQSLEIRSSGEFSITVQRLLVAMEQWGFRRRRTAMRLASTLVTIGITATVLGAFAMGGMLLLAIVDLPRDVQQCYDNLGGYLCVASPMLGLGPMLIVWGCWICCAQAAAREDSVFIIPGTEVRKKKTAKSIICLALGLATIGCGLITGIPAVVVGIFAWRELRQKSHLLRGWHLVYQGMAYGIIFSLTATYFQFLVIVVTLCNVATLRGMEAYQRQDLKSAETLAESAVAYCPKASLAHRLLGLLKHRQGRYKEAIEHLDQAIGKVNLNGFNQLPRNLLVEALVFRSKCHEELNDHEAARRDLDLAREVDSSLAEQVNSSFAVPVPPPAPMAEN